jgi:ferredoxin
MAIRVNPRLIDDLNYYGAEDVRMCYHCGDCSAVCLHADDVFRFPRKSMRQLQMGLERKLETALEPWLCYYCGQCSEQCPREANPGETMMSLRRWLIGRYDFTGIAKKFFRSLKTEILAITLVGLFAGLIFFIYHLFRGSIHIYEGENAFLPSSFIHTFDLGLGLILGVFLAINGIRMAQLTIGTQSSVKIPWWLYLTNVFLLPWHFFTQKRYSKCETKKPNQVYMPWLIHLSLMMGYVIMLVLVMVYLEQLQSGPAIDWSVHAFGYVASMGLVIGTIYFIFSRLRKNQIQYQKSHGTDWVFVILLLLITFTGILQHILHRSGLPVAANITYALHLMFVVPWLLRMPFSKWSHLIYRPLAMYFAGVYKDALELEAKRLTVLSHA